MCFLDLLFSDHSSQYENNMRANVWVVVFDLVSKFDKLASGFGHNFMYSL